jgi:polyribonucleotide nucleotidyltransferase
LELTIVGTKEEAVMIEAGANEISEEAISEAMAFGHKHLKTAIDLINDVVKKVGKQKFTTTVELSAEELASQEKVTAKVKEFIKGQDLNKVFNRDKKETANNIEKLKEELNQLLKEDNEINKEERTQGLALLNQSIDEAARDLTLAGKRVDGRGYEEIRPLDVQIGILPRTHGSALFTRGETQALSVVTLGAPGAEQYMENMEDDGITKKRYMHHYNSPAIPSVKFAVLVLRDDVKLAMAL